MKYTEKSNIWKLAKQVLKYHAKASGTGSNQPLEGSGTFPFYI
jgi:hypothetical protein